MRRRTGRAPDEAPGNSKDTTLQAVLHMMPKAMLDDFFACYVVWRILFTILIKLLIQQSLDKLFRSFTCSLIITITSGIRF